MEQKSKDTYDDEEAFNLLQKVTQYRNTMPETIKNLQEHMIQYYEKSLNKVNFKQNNVGLEVELPNLEETTLCKIDEDLKAKMKERLKIIRVIKSKEIDPISKLLVKKD